MFLMNQKNHMSVSSYVIWGIVIGSAVGTAASVMMKQKSHPCIRKKAVNALETAGTVMQNLANIAK